MKLSVEQVKNIVALRVKLQARAVTLEEELEDIRLNITALDAALARSSFTKASEYTVYDDKDDTVAEPESTIPEPATSKPESVQIQVGKDIIGSIRTYPDRIVVDLEDTINVTKQTPPFESFFVNRIIGGMRKKDQEEAKSGNLKDSEMISCDIETSDGRMRAIVVSNYRTEDRAQEIAKTVKWVLNRMRKNA